MAQLAITIGPVHPSEVAGQDSMQFQSEPINFEYVFCLGGDGTLLRLLRILFIRQASPNLPKIVTVAMGSLGYLCNFKAREMPQLIDDTILAETQQEYYDKFETQYRFRLTFSIESIDKENKTSRVGDATQERPVCHALNEITIKRGPSVVVDPELLENGLEGEGMGRFDVYINDSLLTVV